MHALANIHRAAQNELEGKAVTCLLLVILADFLFYGQAIGWPVGLFAAVLVAALLTHNGRIIAAPDAPYLLALTLGLAAALIESPDVLPLTLFTLAIITLCLANNGQPLTSATQWLKRITRFLFQTLSRAFHDLGVARRWGGRNPSRDRATVALRNWLLPVLLTVTFLFLFNAANPVIANWIEKINWQTIWDLLSFKRIGFWLISAAVVWAIIRPRLKRHWEPERRSQGEYDGALFDSLLSPGAVIRALILFNALFLLQTVLDAGYLYGMSELPAGMTYAEYAHRGAYPLIATALLAALFVLVALRPGSATERVPVIRVLVYLFIAQNVLLVLSSAWRLSLYVEEYSLTYLRVAAFIWMLCVSTGLVWIVLRLVWSKSGTWLINANVLTLIGILYLCSFVNFDSLIADYNVEHSYEMSGTGQPLDFGYLRKIGVAALPATQTFLNFTNEKTTKSMTAAQWEARWINEVDTAVNDPRGWTFRLYRLSERIDRSDEVRDRLIRRGDGWILDPR